MAPNSANVKEKIKNAAHKIGELIFSRHGTNLYLALETEEVSIDNIKNKKSFLYRINGMPDHIHILVSIHSTIALSDFVKNLKTSANTWLKNNKDKFPDFKAWGKKYAAFTIRYQERISN